ncbi:hypothetical protein [Cupriavidus sp. CP313]
MHSALRRWAPTLSSVYLLALIRPSVGSTHTQKKGAYQKRIFRQVAHMFRFEYGADNVYAQLGLADAADAPLKAEIVTDIAGRMRSAGILLQDASAILGVPQYEIALALCGKFQNFRADELRCWLARLTSASAKTAYRRREAPMTASANDLPSDLKE